MGSPQSAPTPFAFPPVNAAQPASAELPVQSQAVPAPAPELAPEPAAPDAAWTQHPLHEAPVAGNVDVNAFEPVKDVPQPDFTSLAHTVGNPFGPVSTGSVPHVTPASQPGGTPFVPGGPVVSGGPVTGSTPLVPGAPLTTGSIPVVRREAPLQPAGGAKHFRWTHYALLGALMFVLGVVVYNVIRLNS